MINARYGLSLTTDDITKIGEQTLRDELSFNRDAGFTKAQVRLPDFFQEKIEPHQVSFDFSDAEIDQVLAGF